MRAWHTSAHYSTSTGPYVTCGFAIWFAMALFKYWWNNDNYNEIYLKSAPVVQWIMASIIAFGAGSIYDISTRAFSTLSLVWGNFGRNSISGQSLVWGLLISLFVILQNSYILHCDMNLPATVSATSYIVTWICRPLFGTKLISLTLKCLTLMICATSPLSELFLCKYEPNWVLRLNSAWSDCRPL